MGKLTRGYLISAPGCTIVNDSIESVDFEIETGSMDRATLMIQIKSNEIFSILLFCKQVAK